MYTAQLAQTAGFAADLYAESGMLAAYAMAASGQSLRKLEGALIEQITGLARGIVRNVEMDKVRNQLLTATLTQRQTPQGMAEAIGRAAILLGDARLANQRIARLQAVEPRDVQRVLERHVLKAQRVTIDYVQGPAA